MKQQTNSNFIKRGMAISLLLCYLCSFTLLDLAHLAGHQHEQDHCSAEAEENPCHVAIYHHGEKGCDHNHHFSSIKEACALCDALLNRPVQFENSVEAKEIGEEIIDQAFEYNRLANSRSYEGSRNRGPPIA